MRIIVRALATALLVIASVAMGGDAMANHAWNSYHWARTANPFVLQLGNNMNARWTPFLIQASNDWSSTAYDGQTDGFGNKVQNPLRTKIIPGITDRACQPIGGTVQVCNGPYGNNGWLGLAQVWLSNGHITQGTTRVNDTYFNTPRYNNVNEKAHVVCQEIAHTFGLAHQDVTGADLNTCMDYFSNTGANAISSDSTHPNLHDYGQLSVIYAHVDGYNSYTATAIGTPEPQPATGFADDGTPIGSSRSQGGVYITPQPDGTRVVTFIHWIH